MWRFKPFMAKEHTGLEGRTIDIGNLKVHVRNAIAEGGFSSVYLARDVNGSKQYAMKHIICNDEESLQLVKKEISIMKLLKGHPNIVTLCADAIFDIGRTMEALLLMEYCDKSLVNVLENRGAGFFEEKQVLTIFRDICNAVFAMHCQLPPIAHRDLKAENLLLGSDGLWKLCDFGSISTNHKRFEKPEEMGIEEDNIRKYTTPAYRAPEMWDLFRRDFINEKVDIWALGCLLYRICYLKSAFDGESKLQVLNGNYRIPELPKHSSFLTGLIKDMLQSSPDVRPDITQVWFRVNDLLPDGLQKSLPDRPPKMQQQGTNVHEGSAKPSGKPNPMPRRSPPPPPVAEELARNVSPTFQSSKSTGMAGSLGSFWSSQHANDLPVLEENIGLKIDEELIGHVPSRPDRSRIERVSNKSTTPDRENSESHRHSKPITTIEDGSSKDFEINLFQEKLESTATTFQGEAFNAFVAEFGDGKSSCQDNIKKLEKEELLEAEIRKLKEQLTQVNMEKAEITSKYEKLSAICRSQRQEIQELKQSPAAGTPSPNKDAFKSSIPVKEKIEGTVWELQQGLFDQTSPSPDAKAWQAFADEPTLQTPMDNTCKSVRTRNGHHGRQINEVNSVSNTWGFGTDKFRAVPNANPLGGDMNNSQRLSETTNAESKQPSQPAGWAGF